MKRLFITLTALALSTTALANQTITGTKQISGNPIGKRNSYTINSKFPLSIQVSCTFTNVGRKPATLNVWTNPEQQKPAFSIALSKGSVGRPTSVSKTFEFTLSNPWWCRIYTPHKDKMKWAYCSYFSISDATIAIDNPFSNFNTTIHNKHTTYLCKIETRGKGISFFTFRKSR